MLQNHGIQNYVAVSKPFLTTKHFKRRIKWAHMHEQLNEYQYDTVIFTDETSVTVCMKTQRKKFWRKKGSVAKLVTWFQVSNQATLAFLLGQPFLLVDAYH